MYRKVDDFITDWNQAAAGTLNAIKALSDDKLDQAIVEGHNTLGWLANHLVGSLSVFGGVAGFTIEAPSNEEITSVEQLAAEYEKKSAMVVEEATKLKDSDLEKLVESFGTTMPVGQILRAMIDHQTHHRGQMTVLIRQAGLPVPPVMGPTQEMSK